MNRQFPFSFLIIFFLISINYGQQLEHMVPAGFNNPFLKSGQYITTMYFFGRYSESDSKEAQRGNQTNQYSVNFRGYIGLTDNITLSTQLNFYPEQTANKNLYGAGGDRSESFYVSTGFVLSYRPMENLELFSAFDYSKYSVSYQDSKGIISGVIGVDDMGNPIYGERALIIPGIPDMDVTSAYVRIGVTYSGNLW